MARGSTGGATAPPLDDAFAAAHRDLRTDSSIQFEFEAFTPPVVPEWLKWLGETLVAIAPALRVLFWIAVVALAVFLLVMIARRIASGAWAWPWGRRTAIADTAPDWRPQAAPARALLREADALAADQRYSEAAHLLLFRSIEEIDARRPDVVRPALTSRDIARAGTIPDAPRTAFASIVALVERSLFGGRALAETDWRQCRAAYEQFAFAESWR